MISTDDVRRLLEIDDDDAVLVVIEGRAEVIAAGELESEQYRGALEVLRRDDLVDRIGTEPSERELQEQAATLDAEVSELGG